MMTFEEWLDANYLFDTSVLIIDADERAKVMAESITRKAWNAQQARIDELEARLNKYN